jgi:flagellin
MPTAISGGARIRTNTPAENAYNALQLSSNNIALKQLRLSTGKRINTAADDVAGYITSKSLQSRVGSLKSALNSVGDALNVTAIAQDALDNINSLLVQIKDSAASASSQALGSDERFALAKSAYRLSQQIQSVVDSTTFAGKQLINGSFSGEWVIGYKAVIQSRNDLIKIGVDLTTASNGEIVNIVNSNFNINSLTAGSFAGVTGLNLANLNQSVDNVLNNDTGIFGASNIHTTLGSLSIALNNINNVTSFIGGVQVRLNSQEDLLKTQITNYNAAVSRIEDTDVANEQLDLIKYQFLQQASIISLAQANQAPQTFLQLFR